MLRKNVKEILLLYFLSLKQKRHLTVWITYRLNYENYKKEGENRNEVGRKKGSFSKWNIILKTINIQHVFT